MDWFWAGWRAAEGREHGGEVAGGVLAVEDRAAADDEVGAPARDFAGVGDGDAAVHADQDRMAGGQGQLTGGGDPAGGVRGGRLAGPAGIDGQHEHEVDQVEYRLDHLNRQCPG